MQRDQFYGVPFKEITPFTFNAEVAQVFDDMVRRSVPFYDEIHKIICDLLNYHYQPGDTIYDLGCSTGTTLKIIDHYLGDKSGKMIGIDESLPMINKAKEKIGHLCNVELIHSPIQDINFEKCGIVIMNYTLQFIDKSLRHEILTKIYESLRPGGIFILSEKINSESALVHNLLTDLYYDFKRRNGYSELEISQKREALENVLVPLTPKEQLELLKNCGFMQSEMIFQWYNFASFIGIKQHVH